MTYRDIPEHWKQTQKDLEQLCMEGYLDPERLTMIELTTQNAWHNREGQTAFTALPAIKPCAHCGGEVKVYNHGDYRFWWGCLECKAGSILYATESEAIAAANRRPPLPEGLTEDDIRYYSTMVFGIAGLRKFTPQTAALLAEVLLGRI